MVVLRCWSLLSFLLGRALSLSASSDATWIGAQSQLLSNQSLLASGGVLWGVTRFPQESAVTTPDGCTLYSRPNGSSFFPSVAITSTPRAPYAFPTAFTSFVARVRQPNGSHAWGYATSGDPSVCPGSSPDYSCSNSTSWGYFMSGNSCVTAVDVEKPAIPSNQRLSSWDTTFDILVKPAPEFGFGYNWRMLSSAGGPNQIDMAMDGEAPCCVLMTLEAALKIQSLNPGTTIDGGGIMGSCNLRAGSARFAFGSDVYTLNETEGSGLAQVLVMDPSASSFAATAPSSSGYQDDQPGPSSLLVNEDLPDERLFSSVVDNVTTLSMTEAATWRAASFPGGCRSGFSNNPKDGVGQLTTSLPQNIIYPDTVDIFRTPGASRTDATTPTWYLPSSPNASDWYVAFLQTNQTLGRRLPSDGAWSFGRAFLGLYTQAWTAWFPKDGLEWNASRLVAPATFHVLGYNATGQNAQGLWNRTHTFTYGSVGYNASNLTANSRLVAFKGDVPCCMDAVVRSARPSQSGIAPGTVRLGDVLGVCNPSKQTASITWLGAVWPQDVTQAKPKLLTMTFHSRPDPHKTAKIVGGVIGAIMGIIIILIVATSVYSGLSYPPRAKRRLIQDTVFNLVMGVRHDDSYQEGYIMTDLEVQGALSMDRFYNLLPFVSKIPHNQFYASLCSRLAGKCLDARASRQTAAAQQTDGVASATLEGHTGQALAFSILKYESTWATTDQAIVQQWRAGRKGQRHLVDSIEEILQGPELSDFLEGLDGELEIPERLTSKGWLVTCSRILFWTLPNHRVSHKVTAALADNDPMANPKMGPSVDELGLKVPWPASTPFAGSDDTPSSGTSKPPRSLGLTDALHILKMDAYDIKPSEIEIMTNLDGSPAMLGKGAFGEVFKAKYNSVQVVAVKQLREEGADAKAKVDFLREVAIMKRLHAENIVRFLGVCVQESKTMLVTEYMAGGDLHNQLSVAEPGGELAWHNLGRRIAVDIARGLAFLHSQQIVHFDLKSPNILLARDNTAKIADVGLARFLHTDQVTQMSVMGTMAWAAPEVLRGTKDCFSTKVDIYSFGVLLWEIVTGDSPRFGTSWFRPPRVPEECPAWVADLITSCMLEDAAARPTSKDIYRMLLDDKEER